MEGRFNLAMVEKTNNLFDEVSETTKVNFEGLNNIPSNDLGILLKLKKD